MKNAQQKCWSCFLLFLRSYATFRFTWIIHYILRYITLITHHAKRCRCHQCPLSCDSAPLWVSCLEWNLKGAVSLVRTRKTFFRDSPSPVLMAVWKSFRQSQGVLLFHPLALNTATFFFACHGRCLPQHCTKFAMTAFFFGRNGAKNLHQTCSLTLTRKTIVCAVEWKLQPKY